MLLFMYNKIIIIILSCYVSEIYEGELIRIYSIWRRSSKK